jgi:uncharacterized membrane protein
MKERALCIFLGFSIGLNVSLGGVLIADWLRQERRPPGISGPLEPLATLPPPLQKKIRKAREPWIPEFKQIWDEVRQARLSLFEALREQPPDREKIHACLDRVAELQKTHQAMVVDRILKETESMDPKERAQYLDWIGRGMQCPGMGPGWGPPGMGRRGRGPGGVFEEPLPAKEQTP